MAGDLTCPGLTCTALYTPRFNWHTSPQPGLLNLMTSILYQDWARAALQGPGRGPHVYRRRNGTLGKLSGMADVLTIGLGVH